MTNDFDLPDCARHVARHRPNLPPEKRSLASNLIQQIYRYDADPDAMRAKILKTIERIEAA
jgi:hypothetical protein